MLNETLFILPVYQQDLSAGIFALRNVERKSLPLMTKRKTFEKYTAERLFDKSPEPTGNKDRNGGKEPLFVIQEHDATSRHFDFRIECGGVLKSWSVPKGLSTDAGDKRLAIPTEDHPMRYADFEGIIPEAEYGAGTVIIWDRGTYTNLKEDEGEATSIAESFEEGHIIIWLKGDKLRGGYAFIRKEDDADSVWFAIKMKDDEADAHRNPVSTQPESVVSGKTLKDLSDEKGLGDPWGKSS
jgi:DNA ligase D-like protein (predicted 3'-phosphoesterase)